MRESWSEIFSIHAHRSKYTSMTRSIQRLAQCPRREWKSGVWRVRLYTVTSVISRCQNIRFYVPCCCCLVGFPCSDLFTHVEASSVVHWHREVDLKRPCTWLTQNSASWNSNYVPSLAIDIMNGGDVNTLRRRIPSSNLNTPPTNIPSVDSPIAKQSTWLPWDVEPSEWDVLILSTCIKLLLYPS